MVNNTRNHHEPSKQDGPSEEQTIDPASQMKLRTKQKDAVKAAKGRGRGKGGGRGCKNNGKNNGNGGGRGRGKGKAATTMNPSGGSKPRKSGAAKAKSEAPNENPRLGCPTCRWSQGGCHICRRPGYKCRTPRPEGK